MSEPIYLDYNASCPVAPEVLDVMVPVLREVWGNPSAGHAQGVRARAVIERARSEVAALFGCGPDEVVFTSGGTESDNAAIVGVAEASAGRGRHVVTSGIEHPAVERACGYLESRGWEVARVGVDGEGRVSAGAIAGALRPDTTLISVMHAHNETGVVQPVGEIGRLARERGIVFHTDTAQTVGKIPTRLDELPADVAVVAGHKLYAPKGVGALILRRGTPFVATLHGAGHEQGRRAGTESAPLIAALGAACRLAAAESETRARHMRRMRDRLESRLRERHPDLVVHGAGAERLPNTLYCALPGVDANALLAAVEGVAAAAGSACDTGSTVPSRVLQAMGVDPGLAICTLRLTVGRETSVDDVDRAAGRISRAATELAATRDPG